jgi:anti-sigma B factor antagonist
MDSAYRTDQTPSGATVLVAKGRLDFHAAGTLRRQLLRLIEAGATRLVVDLSGVTSIDSSGVGALIFGLKSARNAGGDLRLAAPTDSVAAILGMMNLTTVLVTCDSVQDAFPALA